MKKILKLLLLCLLLCVCLGGILTDFVGVTPMNFQGEAVAIGFSKSNSLAGSVYLGGTPIGVISESKGVTVLQICDVITKNGSQRPAEKAGIKKGDFITKIDNFDINSPSDITSALEKSPESVKILAIRNNEPMEFVVYPADDIVTKSKKLGLQVKNEIAGVGTLTYVRADTKRFGGLGHQISDAESTNRDLYKTGKIFPCNIIGVVKGEEGKAGELRGTFRRSDKPQGTLDKNNFCGIFGVANKELYSERPMIALGKKDTVVPGKAYVYTTIDGNKPEKYEIEIVKASPQTVISDKSMVISITDKRLLEKTGGIVQGMSGSPIVQNGKLIGAITHVFINDPTKGYGIYIDWMLVN
ncbi:MAG: SpoIVB peptidase [Clostridia bacterium]